MPHQLLVAPHPSAHAGHAVHLVVESARGLQSPGLFWVHGEPCAMNTSPTPKRELTFEKMLENNKM